MAVKVSIVIPVYNHAVYLEKCIASALNQTYKNIEVIIVNDASTDHTADIVHSMQKKDSRIRSIQHPVNLGVTAADATGCAAARGNYIAILDADTFFYPDKIKKQVAYLNAHPKIGAVFSLCNLVDSMGAPFADKNSPYFSIFSNENRSQAEWLRYFFHRGNCLCHPSMMIRKKLYQKIGGYTLGILQLSDYDLYLRLLLHAGIHILPQPLLDFTVSDSSISSLSDDVNIRLQAELTSTIQTYESMPAALFKQVFPEYAPISHNKSLMKYYMALLSLQNIEHGKRVWGVQLLEKLINHPPSRNLLLQYFNFGPQQFYKIRTDINPYHLYRHTSCLCIRKNNGHDEDYSFFHSIPNTDGTFELIFDRLEEYGKKIHALRWKVALDTTNPFCLPSLNILWKDTSGIVHEVKSSVRHNGYYDGNTLCFPDPGPIIEFDAPDAIYIKISGTIQYSPQDSK
ncbi:MAG: glycosyltransferase family 2 protein [Christensenellales bacterium]|jgi:glycosyltransferase involved in cell wall biosynthesis